MENLKATVRSALTQRIPRSPSDDQKVVIKHYTETVEKFIKDVVVPLIEAESPNTEEFDPNNVDPVAHLELNKSKSSFTLQQTPAYFAVYMQGLSSQIDKVPFEPIKITQETVDQVVDYFQELDVEEYYTLSQNFLQDSFITLSSWYRRQNLNLVKEKIFDVFEPYQWFEKITEMQSELDETPEKIKNLLTRIQTFLGGN